QREIERRNSGNRTQGKAAHQAPTSGGKLLPVERNVFAINPSALLGCDVESKNGAFDFSARRLNRFSRFLSHGAGKLFFTFCDALRYTSQNSLALEGGQSSRGAEGFYGGGNRGLGVLASALIYLCDHASVEWRFYFL